MRRSGAQASRAQRRQRHIETDEPIFRNIDIYRVALLVTIECRRRQDCKTDECQRPRSLGYFRLCCAGPCVVVQCQNSVAGANCCCEGDLLAAIPPYTIANEERRFDASSV